MNSRRDFIKKASLLGGATAVMNFLPESIQRALAISAPQGSTYLDAEHVVFLMQENRSFDHCFGTMKGVRGYNDPRGMCKPDGLPVWFQTDDEGRSFGPYRLDIEQSKTTWMGSLPHGWRDMVEARNGGKMDRWLEAKRPGNPAYAHLPLTMGYHTRADIPFYYALGDAFTVCDQHFCSSLTGTSPNRSYFWSGTVRQDPRDGNSAAHVDNGQLMFKDLKWKTYPERLQQAGVEWKVYQNELSIPVGFDNEHDDWLGNFTNNNLEFHAAFGVRFHPARRDFRRKRILEIKELQKENDRSNDEYEKLSVELKNLEAEEQQFSEQKFNNLPTFEQQLHHRALLTNTADPDYHKLETIDLGTEEGEHTENVPQGDIFYQFRKDVDQGNLPTVSWLVAPGKFSDHPGFPWYGAWYVSEALDILTKNPEVWKKTIFILNYDENDGYYDHIPPFVPPLSSREEQGALAKGIDTQDEYVTFEQEAKRAGNNKVGLDSPIGLGYRVPLVVASPWSKGGWVNSEVFDLTSPLQFLEHFLEHKRGKKVVESNISDWRRLVCGDLTSVFRPVTDKKAPELEALDRNSYVKRINSSKHKELPGAHHQLSAAELEKIKGAVRKETGLGLQEKGVKHACALPYDIKVNLSVQDNAVLLDFGVQAMGNAKKEIGVPFIVSCPEAYGEQQEIGRTWNFAVRQNEPLQYRWPLTAFSANGFHLEVRGPNGFYRVFKGASKAANRASIQVSHNYQSSNLTLSIRPQGEIKNTFQIKPLFYKTPEKEYQLREKKGLNISFAASSGWYDIEVFCDQDKAFYQRYAGHVENGQASFTDPLMGGVL